MELKKCPFCGGTADVWKRPGKFGMMVYVKCDICECQTRVKTAKATVDDAEFWGQTAVQQVFDLWNRRCADAEQDS